ncbi:MAG: hypothetical protein ABSF64_37775 [Bryobacteraceae bacterium]|jgi:hypothetical protein
MKKGVEVAIMLESAVAAAAVGVTCVCLWITFSLVDSMIEVLKLL